MKDLFGQHVLVAAITMRVIGYTEGGVEKYKTPQANDVPWFDALTDTWPGEPVELEWDLPKGTRFVLAPSPNGRPVIRYRRLCPSGPLTGVVIGQARRHEGILDAAEPGQWVPGGSMVGPKRTLNLYDVALRPIRTKSLVVSVHPRDLELVSPEPAAAPTAAHTGRLGG